MSAVKPAQASPPSPKKACLEVHFVYFGLRFCHVVAPFSEISLRRSFNLKVLKEEVPASTKMVDVIRKDAQLLRQVELGKKKEWKAEGLFVRSNEIEDVIIYVFEHCVQAACSSVAFFDLESVGLNIRVTRKYAENCTEHATHYELEPFFQDNESLVHYFEKEVSLSRTRSQEMYETVKKIVDEESSGEGTLFECLPKATSNNWDENHWTKRLSTGIKRHSNVQVTYSAEMGTSFIRLLTLLKCPTLNEKCFLFRGAPDILHHNRAVFSSTDNPSSSAGTDVSSSEEEVIENTHQRPPLKGRSASDPPAKLGEILAALHILLTSKILKKLAKRKRLPQKEVAVRGLLLDKITVVFQCSLKVKFSEGAQAQGELEIELENYSGICLTPEALCFHLKTLLSP